MIIFLLFFCNVTTHSSFLYRRRGSWWCKNQNRYRTSRRQCINEAVSTWLKYTSNLDIGEGCGKKTTAQSRKSPSLNKRREKSMKWTIAALTACPATSRANTWRGSSRSLPLLTLSLLLYLAIRGRQDKGGACHCWDKLSGCFLHFERSEEKNRERIK